MKFKLLTPRQLKEELLTATDKQKDAVDQALKNAVYLVRDVARKQVPLETGEAEKSIVSNNRRGKNRYNVETLDIVDGVNVTDYINFLHEAYYNLGPISESKQLGNSYTVGRKFLDRAFDDNESRIWTSIVRAFERAKL
jgi:HK97 gp10 family phage protein